MTYPRLNVSKKRHRHLPSLVCDGVNRIRRTYDSQGTLLRAEQDIGHERFWARRGLFMEGRQMGERGMGCEVKMKNF